MNTVAYPLFARRDLDGFFGLFIDNLVQLLLIVVLCGVCGISHNSPLLVGYILPGAAISILLGNVFYAWQAHRLAKRENRSDVTALPYGINTPSLLVYVFFVMVPVYNGSNGSARLAWQMGLLACLGSGLIELAGSFVAERIRRNTPRAALLSTLASIAIGFIAMKFALEVFHRPLVAMLPLAVILITYFSRVQLPLGLPGGFVAVLLGTLCAWTLPFFLPESVAGPAMSVDAVKEAAAQSAWHWPQFAGGEIFELLSQPSTWLRYLSVIVPMGLFNVIGSLQNIESAEAAGDSYDTRSSLAANGVGTIVAACFGSCFPTTIYIGHPGWKGLGARAGYSTLNGIVVVAICLTGTVGLISRVVPMEAGIAIVLWIGIIITAQAFQVTPREHAPAVAIGLFPGIAAWGWTVTQGAFIAAGGKTIQQLLQVSQNSDVNGFLIHGMIVMERGFIFTCMFLAAIAAFLIDRKFYVAAAWSSIAALFAASGLTHAYQVFGGNIVDFLFAFQQPVEGALAFRSVGIAIGYLLFAAIFTAAGFYHARQGEPGA
ncbi:MAG: NCS2 family permease [Planctomycetaceae bacterium]|jgi:adenine/guanine/hypoxanthine permease|nr:NCS2 family permease [Planctomycetaceae bacterium]MBT6154747.1 NCS2 family permease [Planctomycetaceae bacterium]MBT6485644.1 NCS2 family permease [Planctomycetaceae bacterium]MBT6494872.1 NCS2 family permease [Planctomycetaceae bacterium]